MSKSIVQLEYTNKMNGNICCILSESDSNKILNNKFKILNVNLKSIITVLAKNNNVKKIYLRVVKKNFKIQKTTQI